MKGEVLPLPKGQIKSQACTVRLESGLQDRLRRRVHDTLHSLVTTHEIGRVEIGRPCPGCQLRVGGSASLAALLQSGYLSAPARLIEFLPAVTRSPKPDVAALAAPMRAQAKAIAPEQVEVMWAHYELGKVEARFVAMAPVRLQISRLQQYWRHRTFGAAVISAELETSEGPCLRCDGRTKFQKSVDH